MLRSLFFPGRIIIQLIPKTAKGTYFDRMKTLTNIDLIDQVDSYPYKEKGNAPHAETFGSVYTLIWKDEQGDVPLGYVLPRVVDELLKVPDSIKGEVQVDSERRTLCAFQAPTLESRSKLAADLSDYWRANDTFPILRGWRDELWPVYGRNGELLFDIERAASGLFGVMRYGVHLTAFVRDHSASHGIKIWVPRRSPTKSTFPGMLDNTVAGGLMTGEDPFECVIREADEEASLPDQIVRQQTQFVGGVTYIYITEAEAGEEGLIYPEVQWIYDLELPEDVVPQPKDGEVADFSLCTVEQVREGLARGEWKPNCALVALDFFIRQGILTRENEPQYDQIVQRIHRRMPFPGPHNQDPSLGAIDG
ncbi:NUDIX domain-containing protein [Colletotrichum orchidophilum]|uniref:NUDIX domain-containing protein n=1 Tax=Colletotrichum orchidophilum TaxID=1209926 RepID=A0A1G4BJ08_9PEZI|nr:NUDIX domain-containing protein [Colletotrichum orchidophilum]OHF01422.1 NUDIX domain-containing protein [Colletotrichum orchidophilum]